MKCEVPQGSILGPLLVLVYINDLGDIFNKLTPVLFADDSNLVATGANIQEVESNVNQELPKLIEWLRSNRLSLNIKKTHVMVFGKKFNNLGYKPKIMIDGEVLEIVKETKCLGVYLDSELNWKKHVNYI